MEKCLDPSDFVSDPLTASVIDFMFIVRRLLIKDMPVSSVWNMIKSISSAQQVDIVYDSSAEVSVKDGKRRRANFDKQIMITY